MGIRLEHAPRLRGIEPNLEVFVEKGEILGHRLAQIAPGFEQAQGEVLGGTDALRESVAEQAAVGHQLTEQMGDLQEEIEDFGRSRILSVNVFQSVSPTFLNIEAFALRVNFPAEPTSLVRERKDVLGGDVEIADPFEAGGLGLTIDGFGLEALEHREGVGLLLGIDLAQVIHPAEVLWNGRIARWREMQLLVRGQFHQGLEVLMHRGQIAVL